MLLPSVHYFLMSIKCTISALTNTQTHTLIKHIEKPESIRLQSLIFTCVWLYVHIYWHPPVVAVDHRNRVCRGVQWRWVRYVGCGDGGCGGLAIWSSCNSVWLAFGLAGCSRHHTLNRLAFYRVRMCCMWAECSVQTISQKNSLNSLSFDCGVMLMAVYFVESILLYCVCFRLSFRVRILLLFIPS